MPATASRAVLRQSQFLVRRTAVRHASSTSEKAGEAAQSAASKASDGLSRVSSAAGPALSGAAQSLRKIGGRTGKVISFVDSMIPPTLYYSKVGLELAKLVFRGQNMTPPNLVTFQSYFQPLINAFRNPATLKNANFVTPADILARVRGASKKEIALAGVTAAEVIGFFTVGEMIGRMNIVGYRGHAEHHGDH
ncbi:mitochondrial ATP synthase g subunit-domain-containing protein [Aspergillus taichungensis]|uniref:Mitochondrial ATP synthase g subunit-domain-containing protein n=1 Tax=Aspergillus taichungensis TaxID=482145 RepID=A0A2J5I9I2_9EURO|nr:mitochondrial ATP synthase g subunit-domain-containing protein [Aspergillus taichungensis]